MRILAIANAFPRFEEEYDGNYIYKQFESLAEIGAKIRLYLLLLVSKIIKGMKGKIGDYANIPYQKDISIYWYCIRGCHYITRCIINGQNIKFFIAKYIKS